MIISIPENPQHVQNLQSISLLKAQGFEGTDVSLNVSLFEYGLVWRKLENGEYLFIYSHSSLENRFDRATMNEKTYLKKEFDWINWANLAKYLGVPYENWLDCTFPHKICDLINYYGVENIFGTSYWEGFEIKEN